MALVALLGILPDARAASLTWDPTLTGTNPAGGAGTWTLTSGTTNWSNGATDQAWTDTSGTSDTAVFGGAAGTVTLSSSLGALGLVFNTPGYVLTGGTLALGTGGINAGTLSSGTTAISSAINITGAENWNVGSGSALTASGIISGTGALTANGAGTIQLTNANSYNGGTTVSSGTLSVTNATGLGSGAVTVGGAGVLSLNPGTAGSTVANNFSGSGLITLQDPGAASTNTLTLTGSYGGFSGTLNILAGSSNNGKTGFSNATQGNAMSSGTVQIQSGATLYLINALNYGFSTQLFGTGNSENLGALRIEGNANITGGVTLFAASNIGVNSGAGTISGAIGESGGSFGFAKVGAGILVLTGSNTYTGTTTISAGTLQLGNGTTDGSIQNASNITDSATLNFNDIGALAYSGTISGAGVVTKTGAGTLTLSGNNTYTGTTTVSAGTLNYSGALASGSTISIGVSGGGNAVMNILPGASIALASAGGHSPIVVGGGITNTTGQGFLYQSGGSLTGTNYTQLTIGGGASGSSYGYYNLSGGTAAVSELDAGGFNGAATGVLDMSGGTMTVGSAGGWLIVDRTGGSGGIGILNLTGGTMNYTGVATQFQNNWGSNGTAIMNIGNATLNAGVANINLNESNNATNFGEINLLSGGVLQTNSIAPNANGTKLVNFNGGTLKANGATTTFLTTNVTAANVFSGGGTIDNNSLAITIPVALVSASGNGVGSVAITNAGSGYLGAPAVTFTGGGGTGAAGYAVINSGTISQIVITNPGTGYTSTPTVVFTGGGATVAATATSGTAANTSGGMTFQGAGTTSLTAANTYTGTTTINGGSTLQLGSAGTTGALANSSAIVDNGTLAISRTNAVVQGTDFSSAAITGTGGFSQVSTGTTTLNVANTYSGPTTISSGVILLTNSSAIQNSTATINAANGLTFNPGLGTVNLGGLAGTANELSADTGGATVNFIVGANNANTSYSGILSGTGSLAKVGNGTLTLSGVNTFSGGLTISSGTISIAANNVLGGATGTGGAVTLNGGTLMATAGMTDTHVITVGANGGTIDITTTGQYYFNATNTLLGSGTLAIIGNGTLVANTSNIRVDHTNTYSGNLVLQQGGIFEFGIANAIASAAPVTINSQGEFAVQNNVTCANNFTVAGSTNAVLSFENGNGGVYGGTATLNAGANLTVGLRDWYNYSTVRSGTITGLISGSGAVIVNSGNGSGGALTISNNSNSFSGGLTLNNAIVIDNLGGNSGPTGNVTPFGSGTATVNGGGQIHLGSNVVNHNDTEFDIPNAFVLNGGIIYAEDGIQHLKGAVNVLTSSTLGSTYNGSGGDLNKGLFLDGIVSGTAALTLQQSGYSTGNTYNTSMVFFANDSNTYSGTITVVPMAGTAGGSYLGINSSNTLANATINLTGNNTSSAQQYGTSPIVFKTGLGTAAIGALGGSGNVVLTGYNETTHVYGTDGIALTVGGNNASTTYSAIMSGSGSITKSGTGVWMLSGANTYIGSTTVSAGTLLLSGSGSVNGSSGITINGSGAKFVQTSSVAVNRPITVTNGVLDGTTTVGAVTVSSGTGGFVTNGNGAASTFTLGSLTFSGTGNLNLNYSDPLGSVTSQSLIVSGALSTANTGAGEVVLNATPTAGFWGNTTYNLASFGSLVGSAADFTATRSTIADLTPRQSFLLAVSGSFITLTVNGDTPKWTGLDSSNWVVGTTGSNSNWQLVNQGTATDYIEGDTVLFDDSASNTTVNISAANVSPTATTFNNNLLNYTLTSGSGFGIANGALSKSGSGTLTILNANTFSGATSVFGGIINYQNATSFGQTSAITVASGATVQVQGGLAGGSAALSLSGSGAANATGALESVSGANSYAGLLTLGANSVISVDNGSLLLSNTGAITGSGFNLTLTGSGNGTIAGKIATGSGGVTVNGPGGWTLSGSNSYTGAVNLNGGTLLVTNTAGLGAGTTAVNFNGGALSYTMPGASVTNTHVFTVGAGGGTFQLLAPSSSPTFILGNAGNLTGTGTLTVTGTGPLGIAGANSNVLVINNANTGFTGILALQNGGIVEDNNANAIGASGAFVVNSNGMLSSNNVTIAQNVTVNDGGSLAFQNTNNGVFSGAIALSGSDSVRMQDWYDATTRTGVISGTLSGLGSLNVNSGSGSGGVLILTGSNTYTGATTIGANTTVQLGNGGTIGSLSPSSAITDNGTLAVNRSNTVVQGADFSGAALTGSGGFTQAGTGLTILNAANTYSGATTISSGTLQFNGASAMSGNSTITITAGALGLASDSNATFTPAGAQINGSSTISVGPIGSGSNQTLILANTTQFNANATLNVTSSNGYNLTLNTVTTSGVSPTFSPAAGATLSIGSITNNAGTYSVLTFTGAGNTNVTGAMTNAQGNRSLALIFNQTGTVTLSGNSNLRNNSNASDNNNTYINLQSGTTNFNSNNAIYSDFAAPLNINAAVTIDNTSGNAVILAGNHAISISSDFTFGGTNNLDLGNDGTTLAATHVITTSGTATLTLSGAISGSGGLTKSGTGALLLSNANSYTGGTTLNAGTLKLGNGAALGSGTLTINGGSLDSSVASLVETNTNAVVVNSSFAFVGTQNLNLGTGAVTESLTPTVTVDANTLTIGGVISGANGITVAGGSGTLVLAGANTFTGPVTVNGGTLAAGVSSVSGVSGPFGNDTPVAIANAANAGLALNGFDTEIGSLSGGGGTGGNVNLGGNTLTVVTSSNATYAGNISGGGNFTVNGANTQTLTGFNGYSGATTIGGGATLQLGDGTGGNDGAIANTSGVTDNGTLLFNRAGANTANYAIAGTGNVTVSGPGSQTLANANNNYSGATTVNGTLIVAGAITGSGPVNVNSGGTLGGYGTGSGDAINGTVTIGPGGNLYPGVTTASTGNLNLGNLTLGSSANITLNVGSGGSSFDTISDFGSVNLSSDSTDTLTLDLLTAISAPTSFDFLFTYGSYSNNFAPNAILTGPGANGQYTATVSYDTTTDNGYMVTFTAVPEPGTWGMLLSGVGMLVAVQRMRRRHS